MYSTKRSRSKPEKHIHPWNVAGPLVKSKKIICYCSYEKCRAVGVVEHPSAEEWRKAMNMIPGNSYKWDGNYWLVRTTRSGARTREFLEIIRTAKVA